MSKLYIHEHRGYLLQQTPYNWHYIIYDLKSDKMVLHAQCNEELTEEKAKEKIDAYIELMNIIDEGD